MNVEEIIFANDRRGISALRAHLRPNFCEGAALQIAAASGTVLIATGFHIASAERPETDGPPGALALGQALRRLGLRTVYVTDEVAFDLMHPFTGDDSLVLFPTSDYETSQRFAEQLLDQYQPSFLISIERCGRSRDGRYLNMKDGDISAYTGKVDILFDQPIPSIGIGDGGNEIGMGNLASVIPLYPGLPKQPSIVKTSHLIVASVANWGAYGLLATLSTQTRMKLLPSRENQREIIRRLVSLGAVDGITGQPTVTIDGHTLEANEQILYNLEQFVAGQ